MKNRANTLSAILNNLKDLEGAYDAAMDAEGSALKENEAYLDSIQGRIDLFINSLQTMWMNFISDDVVKFVVDLGTALIKLVDTIGVIPTLFAGLSFYKMWMKELPQVKIIMKEIRAEILETIKAEQDAAAGSEASSARKTAAKNKEIIATKQASAAETKEAVTSMENAAANKMQAIASDQVQKEKMEEAIANNIAKESDKKEAASSEVNAVANTMQSGSAKGVSISKIVKGVFSGGATSGVASILTTFAKTAGKTVGWLVAIEAAMWAIGKALNFVDDEIIHRAENIKEEVKELKDVYEDTVKTLNSNIDTLTESSDKDTYATLNDEFKKLANGVDAYGNNISLTSDQYERYKQICEQIVGIQPGIAAGYDSATQAIGNNADVLSNLIELQKEAAVFAAKEYLSSDNLKKYREDAVNDYENTSREYSVTKANTRGLYDVFDSVYDGKDINSDGSYKDDIIRYVLSTIMPDIDPKEITSKVQEYYSHPMGDYDISGFFSDYGEKIRENASKFGAEYEQAINDVVSEIDFANKAAEDKLKGSNDILVNDVFLRVPFSNDNYSEINDAGKKFISEWITNDSVFKVDQNRTDKAIEDNVYRINKLINDLASNSVMANYDGGQVTGQDLLDKYYNFDLSTVNFDQYKAQVNDILKAFWAAIGGANNQYDFKDIEDLKVAIGVDFELADEKIEKATEQIGGHLDLTIGQVQSRLDNMNAKQITAYYSIDWNAVDWDKIDGWQDVMNLINKEAQTVDIVSVKSYSELTSSIESYNEVLSQTSEIIIDGTEVTQEYKDSLIELGATEEEIAECFDDENKLVVKNAKALNNLVKSSKSNIAQNVKLAKSQARLQYYKLYKEIHNLTNGKKVESIATLNQVKALYQEMTALQKVIARYSMLEHQLLGATNAYEEFADAQEIDAANDYETQAEELVGYLVDAFHTAKLGTESAQAAIKGLVPESVYADLDTLDEKMQAVYDYFTEDLSDYFYVKFNDDGSLESAEMLIDNVKKFVENGISNGVFTGSWEEWDLDPSIDSLDELAEKMNVTKEVAFAFLQAMETYDISWIGGDYSTLLDKLLPTTEQIKASASALQEKLKNTSIDIKVLPKIDTSTLSDSGWTVKGDQTFEVETYKDSDGAYVNLTPVLPNNKVVSKEEFDKYVQSQLDSGKSLKELTIDGYKVYVESYDTEEAAKQAAEQLEAGIKDYQNMKDSYSLENDLYRSTMRVTELEVKIAEGSETEEDLKEYSAELTNLNNLQKLAKENSLSFIETSESLGEAKDKMSEYAKTLGDAKEAGEDWSGATIDGVEYTTKNIGELEEKVQESADKVQELSNKLVSIGDITEYELQVGLDQAQTDIDNFKKLFETDDVMLDVFTKIETAGFENFGFEKDGNGEWTIESIMKAFPDLNEEQADKVREFLGYVEAQHDINMQLGQNTPTVEQTLKSINDTLEDIVEILSIAYHVNLDTTDAEAKADGLLGKLKEAASWFGSVWGSITVGNDTGNPNVPTYVTGGGSVNGTAHARGTAFKNGSWGAPKTETSLVGELGPEMRVRGSQWELIGQNGAEFTDVKKGDIIFNHKQTEALLKNGYVTSRGKAYASGTTYAAGSIHPWTGGMNIDDDWQNIDIPIWNDATNGEYLADSVKDAADEFKDIIDWVEIRLEEINEQLDLMSAKLENAVGHVSKNNIIDQMLSTNGTKLENLKAGLEEYASYAAKLLAEVPSQYREAAQNGAIAIEEFAGEAGETTVEAINNYREWAQKVADLTQQVEELETEIADLAKQKFDNVSDEFENIVELIENANDKLDAQVSLMEDRGYVASKKYYESMVENTKNIQEELKKEKDSLQAVLDEQVLLGNIKVGSEAWYEMVNALYEVDASIVDCTSDLESFQNAINDIYWDNFDELINRLDYLNDETESLIDLMDSEDLVAHSEDRQYTPDGTKFWTANDVDWTDEGLASLGLHAQQMEIAEFKAIQYAEAINDLEKDYADGKYSENEYLEKLNELTEAQYDSIESYYDAQDAIKELNETRIDSIKEGIEKEIDAYSELIEKQKELLDSEKDMADFQESIADQEKNISIIERKLAALSSDNSISAAAQRKQLQAELAEAQYELDKMYTDRSYDDKQTALDKELEDFQAEKDAETQKWEEYLENVEVLIADSLTTIQANASGIYDTLSEKANEYDLTLSDAIMSPWQDGALAVSDYQEVFDTAASSTMDQLEAIKLKWQEIIDLMTQKAEVEIAAQEKQNNRYVTPAKTAATKPSSSNNNKTSSSSAVKVGSTINAGNAKIYVSSYGEGAGKQYYASDPVYVVIGENNGYWKVRHRSLKTGVTGWFKKSDVKAYAKGTKCVDENQLAWIDELGEELVLNAGPDGRLQYLTKGTSVIPSDISENLMKLGQLDPQNILDRSRPTISAPHITNNETVINLEYGDILHIDNFSGDNPDELSKMIDKAFDKHMKGLNQQIRRFTR